MSVLFPHLGSVVVELVFRSGRSVRIRARSRAVEARCPGCGTVSRRRHSGYTRRLADRAVGGQEVGIDLRVHRYFCDNDECGRRTFAEQIDGLTVRHGRRSVPLRDLLQQVALALGGRAGARLTGHLAAAVRATPLLRLVRGLPLPEVPDVKVLGVDEFATRKGHVYADRAALRQLPQQTPAPPRLPGPTLGRRLQQRRRPPQGTPGPGLHRRPPHRSALPQHPGRQDRTASRAEGRPRHPRGRALDRRPPRERQRIRPPAPQGDLRPMLAYRPAPGPGTQVHHHAPDPDRREARPVACRSRGQQRHRTPQLRQRPAQRPRRRPRWPHRALELGSRGGRRNTRIKMIKRQGYGRANFDFLRRRILLSA
ncbi:transposase family protein [Streptomyces sp. ISL-11]|nr:transposase family protein [Streptomyces sp. ISL-11]